MSISKSQALTELAKLTSGGRIATPDELRELVSQISVEAGGNITVLYGGKLPNGESAGDVVEKMGDHWGQSR